MNRAKPLAVTCGEPAGIGPEIIAKAYDPEGPPLCVLGNPSHFELFTSIRIVASPGQAAAAMTDGLPILPIDVPGPAIAAQTDPAQAKGVIAVIERAVALAKAGEVSGVVTAPIHKKALQDGAGFAHPGHTEFLASLAGDVDVVMMLASDQLRVVPTTIHIPLSEVKHHLTPNLLRKTIEVTANGMRDGFGISSPRIAVAGVNPHAGEGGAMGREEMDWIGPLVREMQDKGYDLTGPHSADTMFHAAARTKYDAAICMYHDQALIPIKTLDFDRGVNVTLGLPFIRTSPDHGTAFDIAGTGKANPSSMKAAIDMAANMALRRGAL